jgi:hypothetical protein
MQFAPTAQEEAEKINAQTGAGYVTNQEFWEKQGISTGEELAVSILNQTYSDLYKELIGFRPRHRSFETVEDAQKAIDALDDEYNTMIEMERMDAEVRATYEAERAELEELMPGQFDFDQYPMQSGMGRRMENKIRISKKQLQKIIVEVMHADFASSIVDVPQQGHDHGDVYGHGGTARHSKQQLFNVSTLSQSLHDRLQDDDELPEWIQSSLAVIEAKLIEVAAHLEYKIHRKNAGD